MHTPSIIIDFETVDNKPTSTVLDLAAIVFDETANDSFLDIVNDKSRWFHVKFDVKKQPGRTVGKDTLKWWSEQGEEAQKILRPSPLDCTLAEGMFSFRQFCMEKGVDIKKSLAYSRGQGFDFPILAGIIQSEFNNNGFGGEYSMFPVAFWQLRDTRTAIAYAMLDPHLRKLPVPAGTFDGFIPHNSVHDCAKDIIALQTAIRYGKGEQDIPEGNVEWI